MKSRLKNTRFQKAKTTETRRTYIFTEKQKSPVPYAANLWLVKQSAAGAAFIARTARKKMHQQKSLKADSTPPPRSQRCFCCQSFLTVSMLHVNNLIVKTALHWTTGVKVIGTVLYICLIINNYFKVPQGTLIVIQTWNVYIASFCHIV